MLYLVGTPIGNLEDMTFRAVRVLKEASLIAAEDTRHTRKLLNHYEIETKLTSYHEFTKPHKLEELVGQLAQGIDIALVSDAGMPAVSDPGYRLVVAAIEAGVDVVPIPGATAAVTALVASGLPTDRFLFLGFLPKQKKARQAILAGCVSLEATLICYESPNRLVDALKDCAAVFGPDRPVVVARELTKLHEELWRGSCAAAIEYFEQTPPRGEITFLVGGKPTEAPAAWDEAAVLEAMQALLDSGLPRKEAAAQVAERSGWRRKAVYNLSLSN